MRIVIISLEVPYPPNHGAKVDIWNRILAFRNLGHEVYLISWLNPDKDLVTEQQMQTIKMCTDGLILLPVNSTINRLLALTRYPSLVTATLLSKKNYAQLLTQLQAISPDFILIDGIYTGHIGTRLSADLQIPAGVRLHNIEHQYMSGQFRLERRFKPRLSILAAILHLKRYEYAIIKKAKAFFDISMNDLNYWQSKNLKHGIWLPPVLVQPAGAASSELIQKADIEYDLGFAGNLHTPNNVEGLKWFISKVLPVVIDHVPNLKFLIMGSAPSTELIELCKPVNSITLLANPENLKGYYHKINILINPVQFGSGVNIKAIDMLFSNNQIVSTSTGVKGLPPQVEKAFYIKDSVADFSGAVIDILCSNAFKPISARVALRKLFQPQAVSKIIEVMMAPEEQIR